MKIQTLTAIGAILASIALHQAQAQTKPARMVTRDELRVCMNTEGDLATRRKALDERNGKNREEAAAIRAEAEEMRVEQKRVEDEPGRADRFNRRVRAHNERVKAAQTVAETFRGELEALNKELIAYNETCGGITFLSEDKEAILKEREAGKK